METRTYKTTLSEKVLKELGEDIVIISEANYPIPEEDSVLRVVEYFREKPIQKMIKNITRIVNEEIYYAKISINKQ